MEARRHRPSLFFPLLLIAAGVLLLLNQTGRLAWDVWATLWRFWPVIFILIGLDILVGASRSSVVYILGAIVALAIMAGLVIYLVWQGGQVITTPPASTDTILESSQDASSGSISLRLSVARAEIGALSDSPSFVEGTIEYGRYSQKATSSYSVSGGNAVFSLSGHTRSVPLWGPWGNVRERWSLRFTPRIPLELSVDTGVGDVSIDLSKLKITRLDVKGGVGTTAIILPSLSGMTTAEIDAGVGTVRLSVPRSVGARVRVTRGLGSVDVAGRFTRTGDEYVTAGFAGAENRVDLTVRGGVGSITIE